MKNDMITGYDMKGTREKCLVPALRFPEFKEEWKTDLMQQWKIRTAERSPEPHRQQLRRCLNDLLFQVQAQAYQRRDVL